MSSLKSPSSSSSTKKKKSKRHSRKSSKLSGPAASLLLSPVVELDEDYDFDASPNCDDYWSSGGRGSYEGGGGAYGGGGDGRSGVGGGSSIASGEGNYGGDNNLRGLNEDDWDPRYHSTNFNEQQFGGGRQLYPQHILQPEGGGGGGGDASFDSASGIVSGGEVSYGGGKHASSTGGSGRRSSRSSSRGSSEGSHSGGGGSSGQQRHIDDDYLHQAQQNYWSAKEQRELDRRRLKSVSDSMDVSLPFASEGGSYSHDSRSMMEEASAAASGGSGSGSGSSRPPRSSPSSGRGGGYSVTADSSIYSTHSTSSSTTPTNSTPTNSSATSSSAIPSSSSLMPLPGFEEADLLQRAIERRALLHNRIVAMEAAKAELEMQNDQRGGGGHRERHRHGERERQHGEVHGGRESKSHTTERRESQSRSQMREKEKSSSSSTPSKRKSRSSRKEPKRREQASSTSSNDQMMESSSELLYSSSSAMAPPRGYQHTAMRHPPSTDDRIRRSSHSHHHNHQQQQQTAGEDEYQSSNIRSQSPSSFGYNKNNDHKPFDEDDDDDDDYDFTTDQCDQFAVNQQYSYDHYDLNNDQYDDRNGSDHANNSSGSGSGSLTGSAGSLTGSTGTSSKMSKKTMGEHHKRMNELSERIKREALEFMNFESSYAEEKERLMGLSPMESHDTNTTATVGEQQDQEERSYQEVIGRAVTPNNIVEESTFLNDDGSLEGVPEENEEDEEELEETSSRHSNRSSRSSRSGRSSTSQGSRQSSKKSPRKQSTKDSAKIDSSAWGEDNDDGGQQQQEQQQQEQQQQQAEPLPPHLSRYFNMVRLGIPDVAVLRSMERDGIEGGKETLKRLKEEFDAGGGGGGTKSPAAGKSGRKSRSSLSAASSSKSSLGDRQDIWQRKRSSTTSTTASRGITEEALLGNGDNRTGEDGDDLPLGEDPHYSKYFKMLKAKVPRSWVKRVLEVDGKDARVLDLDPDRTLKSQVPGGSVDEFGNVNWDGVNVKPKSSPPGSDFGDSSDDERKKIPEDTFASVKAELAKMTAKAGEMSGSMILKAAPSDENLGDSTTQPVNSGTTDSTSDAVAAAAVARMTRLQAIRDGTATGADKALTEVGRRRQTVDEIRGGRTTRQNNAGAVAAAAAGGKGRSKTYPEAKAKSKSSSSEQKSVGGGSVKSQSYEDIPLKDDPRFSKYFQMIRSRVPRSWVERVIEVDDRDPAILDLDPNKSLASQIGEEEMPGKDETDSTYISVDATDKSDQSSKLQPDVVSSGDSETLDKSPDSSKETLEESKLPITQIREEKYEDDKSEASSVTFKDTVEEKSSSIDLGKVASMLDRMNEQIKGGDSDAAAAASESRDRRSSRFTAEEVENRLSEIIERFGTKKQATKGMHYEMPEEQKQLLEKSQADIAKLSSLLATKVGQPDTTEAEQQLAQTAQQVAEGSKKQSDLENLSSLLSQVLDKMERPQPAEEQKDSGKDSSKNKALEALFAKRASVIEEEESKPKNLGEDPEYAKYFKMQKLGLPRASVVQALERDGKDATILDLDPNRPLEEQKKEAPASPDKNAALKDLFAKRASAIKEKEEAPDKNAALKALFAKRAADSAAKEKEGSAPPLKVDPEYQKYMKMLKVGMPKETVRQALERDGKDPSVADMDPEKSYASQTEEKGDSSKSDAGPKKDVGPPPLKDDPEFKKFFKMLKMGIPMGAVRQALQKEGKDPDIAGLDPEKSYASQVKDKGGSVEVKDDGPPLKDDPEYKKFFKMLKMGIPLGAVRQALQKEGKDPNVAEMDPEKSYASQVKGKGSDDEEKAGPPLKDDPEYTKFFKMLKMGIPLGAVRQALQKEGKDPNVVDMDPEKSYASQTGGDDKDDGGPPLKDDPEYAKFFKMLKMGIPQGGVRQALQKEGKDPNVVDMDPEKSYASQTGGGVKKETGPPLKDDPEYAKFFKMLKMGIPPGAVQNALKKEGKDINIINLDPEKPLSAQQKSKEKDTKKPTKPKGPKVARKRLHWNKIDESKLHEDSFWNKAKADDSLKLVGLDVDNEEFASLFTADLNKKPAEPKKDSATDTKKPTKQKVQLIDGRRRMNGSILLTKFKVDYKVLARQVDNMEYIEAEGNEIRGMMQLLPTKDESLALRSYLPPSDAPQSEIEESISKLGECEQYMAVMLDVPDAKGKFESMLFRAEFEGIADNIRDGTKLLIQACDSVKNSERFRKLLLYALKLGNALNTGGANEEVRAITLDSLLKLAEAKAFDRQTSVLHYLVSIVQKNDEDVLKLSEDFVPVKAAERVSMDMLAQQLREMEKGAKSLKEVVRRHLPKANPAADEMPDDDELLSTTPMGQFSLSAGSKLQSLIVEFANAKSSFSDLLQFFGEDKNMTAEAFFCTINTFVSMFDQTHKELVKKHEAKERKKRIDEKRKLREQEMAAKKLKA